MVQMFAVVKTVLINVGTQGEKNGFLPVIAQWLL